MSDYSDSYDDDFLELSGHYRDSSANGLGFLDLDDYYD